MGQVPNQFLYAFQMTVVYNEMLKKKQQAEQLAAQGKHKYEYDSDEDTEVIICLKLYFSLIFNSIILL